MVFKEGMLVMGGDLNVPLCPTLDSSSGSSSIPYRALRRIKLDLASLGLHDTWRILHPTVKDYTFFSHTQTKYSRLDYFLLSQQDLPLLHSASIEPMVISDHHLVSLTLSLSDRDEHSKIWRYDTTLLSDILALDKVKTALKHYFTENATPDISPLTTWEAHKCVLRGVLLKLAAQCKHRSQKATQDIISEFQNLEASHKLTKERESLQKLMDARARLLEEMGRKQRRQAAMSQKLFYDQSNKPGRLLARTLRAQQAASRVHSIHDSN